MAHTYRAPTGTNPSTAGWLFKFVRRDGDEIALCTDPAVRHLGVVTWAADADGGEITVARPGEVAEIEVGTTIDIGANDLIGTDASSKAQPAVAPNRVMALAIGQYDVAAPRRVTALILDGLTVLSA